MEIEDYELSVFCEVLSDAYKDSYIEPDADATIVPTKYLDEWVERLKKKRRQIEDLSQGCLERFHFFCENTPSNTRPMNETFEQMKEFLEPLGVIKNGAELKKAYLAFSFLLEDGVSVPRSIQEKLGQLNIAVSNSPLTAKDKKHIPMQAAATVIYYLNGWFNTQKIKKVILRFRDVEEDVLGVQNWRSLRDYDKNLQDAINPSDEKDLARDLEDLIDSVCPTQGQRKGRPKKIPTLSKELVLIPGIFVRNRMMTIHFPKLRRAISYIVYMLWFFEIQRDQIMQHPIIEEYRFQLPVFFRSWLDTKIEATLAQFVGC